jgi:hypothetical protein
MSLNVFEAADARKNASHRGKREPVPITVPGSPICRIKKETEYMLFGLLRSSQPKLDI